MKLRYRLSFVISLILFTPASAQKKQEPISSSTLCKSTGKQIATLMNINNMSMWIEADGILYRHSYRQPVVYPKGTAGAIYQDGIMWGGRIRYVAEQQIRVGGSRYSSGLRPGRILTKGIAENIANPDGLIWRIRRDWQTVDLTRDVAEYYNFPEDSVTKEDIANLRSQYEKDWNEWPWEKGAPFYDDNRNGIMDDGEEPGLAYADQVVWYVANDLDRYKMLGFMGSYPIGLEIQVTLWAYNRTVPDCPANLNEALQNIIFKRVRLIYKGLSDTPGGTRIDSMYISQWSDPDLGYFNDDLVGCDTLLDLGFVYNGKRTDNEYRRYNLKPPAAGYCFLLGPSVPSIGNHAIFNMQIKKNSENLGMTAFTWMRPSSALCGCGPDYETALEYYNMFQGYLGVADRLVHHPFPIGMTPNSYPFSGDPIQRQGFTDGQGETWSPAPGDRVLIMSSGPFTMALGDTQEVIIALVGGLGADYLSSISVMKYHAKVARFLAHNHFEIGFAENNEDDSHSVMENIPSDFMLYPNFPNPFNAGTEIRYDLPLEKNVRLVIYNVLGQKVKVLVDETQAADNYKYRWDGTNDFGEKVPSGIYLCRLEAGYWVLTRKMTLME